MSALCNLVPVVIVFAGEFFKASSKGEHPTVRIFFSSVDHAYSAAGLRGYVIWVLIGLAIAVAHAFFYETTFRGLLITLGSRSMGFVAVNTIQTVLYTFWFLIPVVRVILFQRDTSSVRYILTLFVSLLIYESLTAAKLGLLRAATGSVWACIFDHIAFGFILDMIHIQTTDAKMTAHLDADDFVRIIVYQAIALVMASVYYAIRQKKIKEKQKYQSIRHQARHNKR